MPYIYIDDFTAQINQEIKDKKLTSKDNEYFKLKMKDYYNKTLRVKEECPTCGKMLSVRTLRGVHKCKLTKQPIQNDLNV